MSSSQTTIGGPGDGRNTIISNGRVNPNAAGISISNGSDENVLVNNLIGINASNVAAGNAGPGVSIFGAGNEVRFNVVSGNGGNGIELLGLSANNNVVQRNRIGVDIDGLLARPNGKNGVQIGDGANNLIGGNIESDTNVISGNLLAGVEIGEDPSQGTSQDATGNEIQGNLIGLGRDGTTPLGNGTYGVVISAAGNIVGGNSATEANLISSNGRVGVVLSGAVAKNNLVQGNGIGIDLTQTVARANLGQFGAGGIAIVNASNNTIGGTTAGLGNRISGNVGMGIAIVGSGATGNLIQGNTIGDDFNGDPLPNTNHGIFIGSASQAAAGSASNNMIGGADASAGNRIAFNGGGGVVIGSGTGNGILSNSIFENDALGIGLGANGVSTNDSSDSDSGANKLQNFATFVGVPLVYFTDGFVVNYKVSSSAANSAYPLKVQFFLVNANNPEGKTLVGTDIYSTANANKSACIDTLVTVTTGDRIVATVTDANNNTSEFSPVSGQVGLANYSVTVAVSPAQTLENGAANLVYTFTRNGGPACTAMTVNFNVGGTATLVNFDVGGMPTPESDYSVDNATTSSESAGSVTFAAGQTTKTLTVDPIGDTVVESNETVVLALLNGGLIYGVGTPSTATGTIVNDDQEVTVAVSPLGGATEDGTPNLVYTFTRVGATAAALTVNFTVGGTATLTTDYTQTGAATFTATAGTVSFSAGQTTKTVTINPAADMDREPDETVILTITPTAAYTAGTAGAATGTIKNDDPRVTLAVSPASIIENGTPNAVVTFTRAGSTANALSVIFAVGGTATLETDYTTSGADSFLETAGRVTFGAGQSTKTVTIDPTGDSDLELNETVVITVSPGDDYVIASPFPTATATITNDDQEVSVAVSPAIVTEDGTPNLVFTFSRVGATSASLTANFTVGGSATRSTDFAQTGAATFTATAGTVSSSAGQTTKTVTINPTSDTVVELNETVILTLSLAATYLIGTANSATGTIMNDDPRITLVVAPSVVTENGTGNSVFTFSRTGSTADPIVAHFNVSGTATLDTDYSVTGADTVTETEGSVTIPAGQSTKTVIINPTGDADLEPNESIVLTLAAPGNYFVGTIDPVTATIANDDTEIAVAVNPENVNEHGTPNLIYTFTRNGPTSSSLTVNFTIGGTATLTTDYTQTGAATFNATTGVGTVTIASGQTTKLVTINPVGDLVSESDETIILTVTPAATYSVGTANSATGTITNDDGGLLRMAADHAAQEIDSRFARVSRLVNVFSQRFHRFLDDLP